MPATGLDLGIEPSFNCAKDAEERGVRTLTEFFGTELAEKLTRRRARVAAVMALFFMMTMLGSLNKPITAPETFRLSAWLVWAVLLLVFLTTGGALWRGRNIRSLMNDESTISHRQQAFVAGFWTMIVMAFATYAFTFVEPISARDAIRALLTMAIVGALLKFSILERRSLRD